MDYAGNAIGAGQPTDRPYLARIEDAADELDRIAGYLDAFITRCRGDGPTTQNDTGPRPTTFGHLPHLDRLFDNLARIDALARELQDIG